MTNLLQNIDGVAVYFDDVVVGSKNSKEHDFRMHKILDKLEVSGFKLNVKKSAIRMNHIKYLGHIIFNQNGITSDPLKTKAIKAIREPMNLNKLKSFLGMIIHYAKFIPKLSIIAKPLNKLTKKNKKFIFNDECRHSFEALKNILSSNKVLVLYSNKIPVIFASNASQYGYGAVFKHKFDDGSEKPIEYVSKTFNDSQVNYSQIEKEYCAIVNEILRFKDYLLGREFVLQTDSLPLKFLLSPDTSLPNIIFRRIDRWACQLKRFQFKIELPLNESQNWELNDTEKATTRVISVAPLDADNILRYLRSGWPKNLPKKFKEYRKIKFNLAENDGIIMKNEQIIIPLSLQFEVFEKLHSGYVNIVRIKMLARSNVYWMGMNKQIEDVTKNCETCIKIGIPESNVNLHAWEPAKEKFEKLHIDVCGLLDDIKYLIIYDMFTGYPFIERLRKGDSQEIIDILDRIFIDFMYPKVTIKNIRYLNSPPYHPRSNGAAENLVKKFKTVYFKFINDGHSHKNAVKMFLEINKNAPNTRTHESPYKKMFNKKFKLIKEKSRRSNICDMKKAMKFKENEKVWEKIKNIKEWNKATVVKRMETNMYKVYTEHRSEPQIRHTDQLRKRKSPIGTIRRSERLSKKPRRCYIEMNRGGVKAKVNENQ
uniref:RNA-directed DNA polymerase n=1 Tax=Strongyloides venezuelensis TaxID=75913 RepID=A0A0K0FPR6_STRVS